MSSQPRRTGTWVAIAVVIAAALLHLSARGQDNKQIKITPPASPISRGGFAYVRVDNISDAELAASTAAVTPDDGVEVWPPRMYQGRATFVILVATDATPGKRVFSLGMNAWRKAFDNAVAIAQTGVKPEDSKTLLALGADFATRYPFRESTAVLEVAGLVVPPPKPPPEPGPDPPGPVNPGKRTIAIIHESNDTTPSLSSLKVRLRTGTAGQYLVDKGHNLVILDDDHGAIVKPWLDLLHGVSLPAVVIKDAASSAVLGKRTIAATDTADSIIALLKQHGG